MSEKGAAPRKSSFSMNCQSGRPCILLAVKHANIFSEVEQQNTKEDISFMTFIGSLEPMFHILGTERVMSCH